VAQLDAIVPSPELLRHTWQRISDMLLPVDLHQASAEALPFSNGAFDTVTMTWTLCSIPDP